jgi:hypothetical protein
MNCWYPRILLGYVCVWFSHIECHELTHVACRHVLPVCNSETSFNQNVKANVLCLNWGEHNIRYIWGCHSGPPRCYAVQPGESVPTFRKETYLVYPKDGACKMPWDVGTHFPSCMTWHCSRPSFLFLFECLFCYCVSVTTGIDKVGGT